MILTINEDTVNIQLMNPELDIDGKYKDYIIVSFMTGCLADTSLFVKCIDVDDDGIVSFEMFVFDKTDYESNEILSKNKEYIKKIIEYLVYKSIENEMKESNNDKT